MECEIFQEECERSFSLKLKKTTHNNYDYVTINRINVQLNFYTLFLKRLLKKWLVVSRLLIQLTYTCTLYMYLVVGQ